MAWPTKHPYPNKDVFVTVRFAPDEAHELALAATAAGTSKSAFTRRCITRCIEADKRKAARLAGKETD